MTSKLEKISAFKKVNGGLKLNPGYLYDIDLLIKAANWIKQDIQANRRIHQAFNRN